jgi:hypothetical protein
MDCGGVRGSFLMALGQRAIPPQSWLHKDLPRYLGISPELPLHVAIRLTTSRGARWDGEALSCVMAAQISPVTQENRRAAQ